MGATLRLHGTPGIIPQAESPLGLALMQLAILTTARAHDQPYEWSLHEMQAIALGLDPAVIDVVRHRKPLAKLGDPEVVVIQVGREIFGAHKLSSVTFAHAMKVLGKSNLVDVVGLMADYSGISAVLTALPPFARRVSQLFVEGLGALIPLRRPLHVGAVQECRFELRITCMDSGPVNAVLRTKSGNQRSVR